MTPSDQTPKLPTWLFIVTDLAAIGAAGVIAWRSDRPFSDGTSFSIVICLVLGAIFGLVPIVARYEREKNQTLDDRQSALEALSRTISSSAEQISIAANGLNGIAELSLKNLRHAEHLPQKLQEKIAEFQAALAIANDTEKEELEKELVALRTTESERLESISEKISKSAADWAKLESATQKNLAGSQELIERAATESLTQLTASTTAAVAQAATAAAAAIAQATTSANDRLATASAAAINQASASAREHLSSAATAAAQSLAQAHARLTADLDEKLASVARTASTATTLAETLTTLEAKIAASTERLERALETAAKAPPPAPVVISATPATIVTDPDPVAALELAPVAESTGVAPPSTDPTAHPPKRPRKPRREPSAAEEAPAAPAIETVATPEPSPTAPPPSSLDEPAPIPATAFAEIAPVTPATVDPFVFPAEPAVLPPPPEPVIEVPAPAASESAPAPAPEPIIEPAAPEPAPTPAPLAVDVAPPPAAPEPSPATEPAPAEPVLATPATEPGPPAADAPAPEPIATEDEEPKPGRRRAAKKPEPEEDSEPGLGLEIDDTPAPQTAELAERVLTSDGATRLIATAYIGIGNRLFIRGEGPGLSWEKGVPLQFVSIGKWRWETSDANSPVSFKLYKNDTVECTALGVQHLDPGHQQELTASF